jgi:TolB protein
MERTALLLAAMVSALVLASVVAFVVPNKHAQAAFPGEDGRIAFVSKRDGDPEIYTMSPTGNNVKRLTDNTTVDSEPSWSANGKKIVFSAERERFGDSDIYTMNADGSNKRLITDEGSIDGPKKHDSFPAFSPDGRKIIFGRNWSIYTINPDGSDLSRLTPGRYEYMSPDWSPDGTKIAFTDAYSTVFTMNSDGSNRVPITPEAQNEYGCFGPDWSPDNARITCEYGVIYVMNADGSGKITLPGSTQYGMFAWESSAFSPGGTEIVFAAKRDGDYDIYTMNDDGTEVVQLTNDPARDWAPDWQPIVP